MKTYLILFGVLIHSALFAETVYDWSQWRGPDRSGYARSETWPQSLNEDSLKQMWKVDLGPSYSGPIVLGDRIFTTETVDKKEEVTRAFDRETGKELWSVSWQGSIKVPFFAARNGSWIRSTPACDGERLYVAGMRDVLKCLDVRDGKEIWSLDFMEEYDTPLPAFGFVCSPLLHGEHVYVQAGASFVKVERLTGNVVWRTLKDKGGMWGNAFSSPAVATLNDKEQLLVQTRQNMNGIDIETGDVLWSREIEAYRGMNILQPVAYKDKLFTSAHSGISLLFEPDVEKAEWTNKAQAYMSTPVVVGGHLYMHLKNQRVVCLNLEDGKTAWTSPPFGKYWSMVVQGDRILGLDEKGELIMIRANPEKFDVIERRKLSRSPTWAHLAVAGDMIIIRELKALTAYRWAE